MDGLSAIGLAGSIVGIIDVATRSISALRRLQERWKAADLTVSVLIGQLTTLKAALDQISKWISTSLTDSPQDHQLIVDLRTAIQSCRLLISPLDDHLSQIEWNTSQSLDVESRVKIVLQNCNMKECASHLSNQSIAFNLLLTALNCQSISEQRELLESRKSRRIFDQVKDDSSSLRCLRNSASFRDSLTTATERSSMLSKEFDFDAEIMTSKVYKGQMKSLLKRAIRKSRQAANRESFARGEEEQSAQVNSAAIDKVIARDKKAFAREFQMLLLGYSEDEKRQFLVTMESIYGGTYSLDARIAAKKTIYSSIYQTVSDILDVLNTSGSSWEAYQLDTIILQLYSTNHESIPQDVVDAIRALWKNLAVKNICRDVTDALYHGCITYFLDSIDRIARLDYLPTDYDIAKARHGLSNPRLVELSVTVGQIRYKIVKPEMMSDLRKLLPTFAGFHCLIFFADLSSYTTIGYGGETDNELNKSLSLFNQLCNSRWLKTTAIILFLTNLSTFKTQLVEKPLQHYFNDFKGGDDPEAAQQYIFARFQSLRKDDGSPTGRLYFHFMDADDSEAVKAALTCVKDIIIEICLRPTLIK